MKQIEIGFVGETESTFTAESIMQFDLEKVLTEYENKLFTGLKKREYSLCEQYLSDFCFELLDMTDKKQVFVARIFFVSIITNIIHIQSKKLRLQPRTLSNAYEVISEIEKWDNISEYILSIKWFIEQVENKVIGDSLLMDGCIHTEKAIQLIEGNLEGDLLTVKWLADQLDISTTHLSNLFKIQIGETVASFITKRKMNEIIFEIAHTNQSLKEVRERFGYFNHSHFIQHFKKHQGVTPLKYKQRLYRT